MTSFIGGIIFAVQRFYDTPRLRLRIIELQGEVHSLKLKLENKENSLKEMEEMLEIMEDTLQIYQEIAASRKR